MPIKLESPLSRAMLLRETILPNASSERAFHGRDKEGGNGAALFFTRYGTGSYGHRAAEEHHDNEHGDELTENVAYHLVVGGLVKALLLVVGTVDVEEIRLAVLIGCQCPFDCVIDTTGGVVGRVVVYLNVGGRSSALRLVGGNKLLETGREAHQHGVDILVGQGVDVGLGDGLLQ